MRGLPRDRHVTRSRFPVLEAAFRKPGRVPGKTFVAEFGELTASAPAVIG